MELSRGGCRGYARERGHEIALADPGSIPGWSTRRPNSRRSDDLAALGQGTWVDLEGRSEGGPAAQPRATRRATIHRSPSSRPRRSRSEGVAEKAEAMRAQSSRGWRREARAGRSDPVGASSFHRARITASSRPSTLQVDRESSSSMRRRRVCGLMIVHRRSRGRSCAGGCRFLSPGARPSRPSRVLAPRRTGPPRARAHGAAVPRREPRPAARGAAARGRSRGRTRRAGAAGRLRDSGGVRNRYHTNSIGDHA